jgi:hypothetical protein
VAAERLVGVQFCFVPVSEWSPLEVPPAGTAAYRAGASLQLAPNVQSAQRKLKHGGTLSLVNGSTAT